MAIARADHRDDSEEIRLSRISTTFLTLLGTVRVGFELKSLTFYSIFVHFLKILFRQFIYSVVCVLVQPFAGSLIRRSLVYSFYLFTCLLVSGKTL